MPAILIVENDDLERAFILSMIREEMREKYTILTARTGAAALRTARQHAPELILLDVLLPDMDGIDMIQELRGFLPQSCISILTACTNFFCAQRAIGLRVFEYMLKPVKPGDLSAVLHGMAASAEERSASGGGGVPAAAASGQTGKSGFIQESLRYIQTYYKDRLTLQDVAGRVYVSAQYFSRMFKKEVGMSFTEYITVLRVRAACGMLERTDYPVYRISAECGFSDPAYFNRIFLQHMNITPQRYRRVHRADKFPPDQPKDE
ncbi:helix-turn-helix domain-containing protein [Dysosmobacter sp.]|uniref:response regulator transcription factor n=1 Tax=Dysosmobacter sp. TaxID=2591382 RepID=UPI003AB60851